LNHSEAEPPEEALFPQAPMDPELALCESLGVPLSDELKRKARKDDRRRLLEAKNLSLAMFESLQSVEEVKRSIVEEQSDTDAVIGVGFDSKHGLRG